MADKNTPSYFPSETPEERAGRMTIRNEIIEKEKSQGIVDDMLPPSRARQIPMEELRDTSFSNEFLNYREERILSHGSDEMMSSVLRDRGGVVTRPVNRPQVEELEMPLEPFPLKEPPEEQSTVGKVMRNVAEVPRAALLGVDSAIRHATDWALNPLVTWLNENVANLEVPVREAQTPTGKITKATTEFLVGFLPALKTLKGLGMAGGAGTQLTAAMIADFATKDPHEARLANLWQEAGLPQNVLTDYLAADPKDNAIEGRFKSAAESVFTGAVLEGVVFGARALRAAKSVKGVEEAQRATLKARYGEIDDATFAKLIGDPEKPMLVTKVKQPSAAGGKVVEGVEKTASMKPEDLVGGYGVVDAGEMSLRINFARMSSPDDVKAVIADMAEKFKGSIDEARRGVITNAETSKMADELGMSVPELLERRKGQAFNAEEVLAARRLWAASGEKLLEAATKAATPNAGPIDQYVFRKMLATHHAVQAEVLGMRAEAGRSLQAWKIPAGGSIEKARSIDQMLSAMGGTPHSQELARRLAILAEQGDKGALARFAEKASTSSTMDVVREVWINGLLSGPSTHVVNTLSNTAVAFQAIYERGIAAQIGQLRGATGDVVAPGEAMAMTYALVTGVKDAFRMAAKSFRAGETGYALNKIDLPNRHAISSEGFGISSETGLGRMVDFVGEASRIPSRFMGAEDEFFKSIGYRMELHAQALRQGVSEGLKGPELASRMREIILNPPEHIRLAAADEALYRTFTSAPGAVGQVFMGAREKVPALTFVLPFVRTPVNIARYTFERTPFAPFVRQWRDDIAAGGARADLALARMGTGTGIMLAVMDMADSGLISGQGSKDQGEREAMIRQGWQPNSFKVGERWYSYNRADPIGAIMGIAANISETVRNGEINEDDVDEWQEVTAMAITAISQVVINKTYLQGVSDFIEVMSDPARYGEGYVNRLVSSFMPAPALSGAIERAVDPTVRQAETPWEAIQAKIAGLSEKLPPRRNLWGDVIKAESDLGWGYDFFTPLQTRRISTEPIDTEIMRLAPVAGKDIVAGAAPTRISKKTTFSGVPVNFKDWPDVYDEYVELAGNDLRHPAWKLGAKDFLNQVVTGNHPMSRVYNMRSDEMKVKFISDTIAQYRKLAQQAILSDPAHEDFKDYIEGLKAQKLQQKMPVIQ